jgi:hypothetical protein
MQSPAPKRGSYSVYPSRRRLRGSLPVVRHDRTSKWQRRSCARRAVGADGKRREIALRRKAVGCPYSPYCLEEDAFSETRSTPYFVGSPELAKVEEEAVDDQAKRRDTDKRFPGVDAVDQPYACARAYATVVSIGDRVVLVRVVLVHHGTTA